MCPVCVDGVAGDHVYYGGRACHSCRVFFRRAVRAGLENRGALTCTERNGRSGGWCEIRSKSRRGCRACRLEKCLLLAGLDSSQVSKCSKEKSTNAGDETYEDFVCIPSSPPECVVS